MFERLLDKNDKPDTSQIKEYIGAESFARLMELENYFKKHYRLTVDLRFPFGNSYGWGYKYSHGSVHLCYAFFESGAFTVTIQIGDKQAPLVENMRQSLLLKTQGLWANRYPCGETGGWIHYRVLSDDELNDVCQLIAVKKKPLSQ